MDRLEKSYGPAWEDPRKTLRFHGIRPNRFYSQHFLISRQVAEAIADAAQVQPAQPIVEIGGGLGALTGALLRRGAHVWVIEKDPQMVSILQKDMGDKNSRLYQGLPAFPSASLVVQQGDVCEYDFGRLASQLTPACNRIHIVGNIPYGITGAIIKNLIKHQRVIECAILMVQKEVAERYLARPSTKFYGTSSVFIQLAFDVELLFRVSPSSFFPRPKVESSVIRLVRKQQEFEESEWLKLAVHSCFSQRRKVIRNVLNAYLNHPSIVDQVLEKAGIDGRRRGETMDIREILDLACALKETVFSPR